MKQKLSLTLILGIVLLISCKKSDNSFTKSDIIYYNGNIITMQGDLQEVAEKQALVVRDDKILFVGLLKEAKAIAGEGYKRKNLEGSTLLPGFIDGHAHFANFSVQAIGAKILPSPDGKAENIPLLLDILRTWNTPKNRALTGWIFGMGFDDSVLEEKRFPTKFDLDLVSTEFPIMIIHTSGHFAVVNSKGLEILEINSATEDPEGGIIRRVKNENNPNEKEPNGVLEELAAIPQMEKFIKPKTDEAIKQFFDAGQDMALKYGYTTAQEGRAMENHSMLAEAAKDGKLKIDVVSYIDYMYVDSFMTSKWNSRTYDNHYRIGGMKLTLDGSPQGRTAWRTKPYLVPPDGADKEYLGYPAISNDTTVAAIYKKAFINNWQILTHANGDAAMDQMIRTMKQVVDELGNKDRRDVLIHGQYVRDDQLDSFKELDIIISLFPLHTYYWGDWHLEIIGDSLGKKISPTRTALNKGLKITIHTDAPVALPNLMRMVGISVERKSRLDSVIGANERLTPYEALKAITIWSAYQHFEEDTKGTLEVGKLADMVILDKNPLTVLKDSIKNIEVLETIKEGIVVYKKQSLPKEK
jgi:predicted amidohydrolase YtcJ